MEPRRSNGAHPQPAAPSIGSSVMSDRSGGSSILNMVLVVLLIITSVIASAYLITRLNANTSNNGAIKSKQYQALFLTNGQVYLAT